MLYHYKKYPELAAFLANGPKSADKTAYTLTDRCGGLDEAFTRRCFGCLFCLFGEAPLREKLTAHWGEDAIRRCAQQAFCSRPVQPPAAADGTTLAAFTAANGDCLPAFAAGILHHSCSGENRISIGVPVCAAQPELGQLAACLAAPELFLLVDAAPSFAAWRQDGAYAQRHAACRRLLQQTGQRGLYLVLLGGAEPTPAEISALAQAQPNGRFITADALFCLCCRFLQQGKAAAWDVLLPQLLGGSGCRGLTSAGAVY